MKRCVRDGRATLRGVSVAVLLCVLAMSVYGGAESPKDRLIRRLEAIDPVAVQAAWADMCRRWPDRFAPSDPFVATLAPRRERLLDALKGDWYRGSRVYDDLAEGRAFLAQVRAKLLANPLLDFDRLLVVRRKDDGTEREHARGLPANYQQPRDLFNGCFNELGILSDLRGTNATFTVLDRTDDHGYIGETCLHWDATRVMYTRRTNRKDHPPKVRSSRPVENIDRVFELALDRVGATPRELALIPDADCNCYAGCYLPDGGLIFLSDASFVGVPCVVGSTWVASLYRKEPGEEGGIRRLTFDQDNSWDPVLTADGRILFHHWEYADITHYAARILFTMNPDGTMQRAYYGSNSYWPNALFNARPCPDNPDRFTAIVTGHHGQCRTGELVLFDVLRGHTSTNGVVRRFIQKGTVRPVVRDRLADYSWPKFTHPYPLSQDYVIVTARPSEKDAYALYLVDAFGNMTVIAEEKGFVYLEAKPVRSTPRPPVLASRVTPGAPAYAKVTDIYAGPGLRGVPRGTVKALRLFTYSFAYRWMGGETDHHGLDGPWDIKRILGTVPVEPDGSAFFELPANMPVAVQPLDADGRALQTMRSWMNVMPGELASCSGCHEENDTGAGPARNLQALARKPDRIRPWYGPERGFSFRREVQPVLDRYCVACHDGTHADGRAPGLTAQPDFRDGTNICVKSKDTWYLNDGFFPPSYVALAAYVRNYTQEGDNDVLVPCECAASTTHLVQMLERGHHGVRLDAEAWDRIVTWIDLNRMGHGTWSETVGTNRVAHWAARRADLQWRYAGVREDHETLPPRAVLKTPALPRVAEPPAKARTFPSAPAAFRPQTKTVGGIVFARIPGFDGKPDYWMGAKEISNAEYARYVSGHDSGLERGEFMQFTERERGDPLNAPDQPVVRVSADEAAAFCAAFSAAHGVTARLPTGDEWERAARAGGTDELWWGDRNGDFSKKANLADATFRKQAYFRANVPGMAVPPWRPADIRFDDGYRVTAPCGAFAPNAWGLYDVHGNAWEWTADRRGGKALARGGSCWSRPKDAVFTIALPYRAWQRVHDVGFRILVEEGAAVKGKR